MGQIMTIKEVSRASGLSEYAIRTGIKNKVFPAFRIGGQNSPYFMDYDEFQAHVKYLGNCNVEDAAEGDNLIKISGIRRVKA